MFSSAYFTPFQELIWIYCQACVDNFYTLEEYFTSVLGQTGMKDQPKFCIDAAA